MSQADDVIVGRAPRAAVPALDDAVASLPVRSLLDDCSDPVVACDMHGRRIYSNGSYHLLTGYPRGALIGHWAPFPDWGRPTEASFAEGVRHAIAARRAGRVEYQKVAASIVHASGVSVTVEMGISLIADDNRGIAAIVASVHPTGRVPWFDRRRTNETADRVNALEDALRSIASELGRLGVAPIVSANADAQSAEALRLSPQEWRVLQELLAGRRVVTIARDLHLSEHTVRNHLKKIFTKVGVHSQAELVERFHAVQSDVNVRLA